MIRTASAAARASLARLAIAVAVGATPLAHASSATDQSDLWWNSGESGWGMQLVDGDGVMFATIFVYDPAGQPTFYSATLAQVGDLAWSGDLERSTGPWFGAPAFDAASVGRRKVGTLAFRRADPTTGTLDYTVDGVVIRKTVQRLPLRNAELSGRYATVALVASAQCPGATGSPGATQRFDLVISQAGALAGIDAAFPAAVSCRHTGTYLQIGKIGSLDTTYTCADGSGGSMSFFDIEARSGRIGGRLRGHGITNGCDYAGTFAGVATP